MQKSLASSDFGVYESEPEEEERGEVCWDQGLRSEQKMKPQESMNCLAIKCQEIVQSTNNQQSKSKHINIYCQRERGSVSSHVRS